MTATTAVKKKSGNKILSEILENKKVLLKPVVRISDWLPPDHDGVFLYEGAQRSFCVPKKKQGRGFEDPLHDLNDEQKEALAKAIGVDVKIFNPNLNPSECFWSSRNRRIDVDKHGRIFDLSDPDQYIDVRILQTNKVIIANSWEERKEKATYQYALVDEDKVTDKEATEIDATTTAYTMFGKMNESTEDMIDFLNVYGMVKKHTIKVPSNPKRSWLVKTVGEILKENPKEFVEIVGNKDYNIMILIYKGVHAGALYRKGFIYGFVGEESIGTLSKTIDYLKDNKNSDVKLKLQAMIENNNA